MESYMVEGYLFECLWTILHLLVKWLKGRKHPGNIVLTKIQPKNHAQQSFGVNNQCSY